MRDRAGPGLFSEIGGDFPHAGTLGDVERATAVAMAAADAVAGMALQVLVVVACEAIAQPREIVVLVDEADLQSCGTGLAVVAVHTAPGHVDRITAAENMDIAALFIGHIVVFYRLQHFFHGVAADNHNFYAVAVQTILNTLRNRHSPPLPFHQRR